MERRLAIDVVTGLIVNYEYLFKVNIILDNKRVPPSRVTRQLSYLLRIKTGQLVRVGKHILQKKNKQRQLSKLISI